MAAIALPYHSNPYNWTTIASRKNRTTMKKNNINKWIDILLRDGSGLAQNIFSFFDLYTYVELRCTSRILDKYVLHYIQNNPIYDPATRIYDIKNFMMLFPFATAIALPAHYTSHTMLSDDVFVGSKIRYMYFYGVDFGNIPDFNPANFTGVDTLYMHNCVVYDDYFFSCMQNVRLLSLCELRVHVSGLTCFQHLQSLEYLDISHVHGLISVDCFEYLDGITTFRATYSNDVTDALIAVLTRSGCLQELDISGCTNQLLTIASIPLLKTVPVLHVTGSNVEFETCDVCGRERSISEIPYHLINQCNMNCQQCNQSIEICNESRHLAKECTQNFIECYECGDMVLGKNLGRHRRRCMNRLVTCTLCSDTEPYCKKDFHSHMQNYEENSFKHFQSLEQEKALLISNLAVLQQKIDNLIYDAHTVRFKLHEHRIPSKHTVFIRQMEQNVAKHANKPLKQLYLECSMMTQLFDMRQKHKNTIERILDEQEEKYRRKEEAYWDRQSYSTGDICDDIRARRRGRW